MYSWVHCYNTYKRWKRLRRTIYPHPSCGDAMHLYTSLSMITIRLMGKKETTTCKWCASYHNVLKNQSIDIVFVSQKRTKERKINKKPELTEVFFWIQAIEESRHLTTAIEKICCAFTWLLSCAVLLVESTPFFFRSNSWFQKFHFGWRIKFWALIIVFI